MQYIFIYFTAPFISALLPYSASHATKSTW